MGYTTDFCGVFNLNKKLDEETMEFLIGFAETRRMKRNPEILEKLGYGKAEDFGVDGEFFVNFDDVVNMGQTRDDSIVEFNKPPSDQPNMWCQWIPTDDGRGIEWDGEEKFYDAEEWIEYISEKILKPKGYLLNGVVQAQGEGMEDRWYIEAVDGDITVVSGDYETNKEKNQYIQMLENINSYIRKKEDEYEEVGNDIALVAIKDVKEKIQKEFEKIEKE